MRTIGSDREAPVRKHGALRRWFVALLLTALLSDLAGAEPIKVIDDAGQSVTLPQSARRIISLAPHVTEILYAVGAGALLIGADEYSDFPPVARDIPRIGRAGAVDVERIVALKPDLVVAWGSGNTGGQVEQLRRLGLSVFSSEPRTLEDVSSTLRRLGILVGRAAVANAAADQFLRELDDLRLRYQSRSKVTVFYQIWHEPLMTVNREHTIGAVIRLCGGENVFGELPLLAPTVSREAVLRADPRVIIGSGSDGMRPAWLDDWRRWPQLSAVRNRSLIDVPPDLMQRPTPRLLLGAARVCAAIESARNGN